MLLDVSLLLLLLDVVLLELLIALLFLDVSLLLGAVALLELLSALLLNLRGALLDLLNFAVGFGDRTGIGDGTGDCGLRRATVVGGEELLAVLGRFLTDL